MAYNQQNQMKANHNDHNYQNCCFSYYPGNDYGQVFPMPNIGMPQQITYVYSYYYPMAPQFESPQMAPSLQYPQGPTMGARGQLPLQNEGRTALKSRTVSTGNLFCNCARTHCKKDYCRCFKEGQTCGPRCHCVGCLNRIEEIDFMKPLQPKKTLRCNCKKSGCSAKYCDCLAKGVLCSELCNCTNCENILLEDH